MEPSTLWLAFFLGLLSACSLPLGTLTTLIYRPSDRVVAGLMAFGGGALLAALTLDLAGPAVRRGHFIWLAAGCILGGALFVVLDQVVNNHGGFLRKMSTTVFHLRREERKRLRKALAKLRRLHLLSDLPREDIRRLAEAAVRRHFRKETSVFRVKDPGEHFFIIEEGAVDLLDPDDDAQAIKQLKKDDAFGYMAFLTGTPHATHAVAKRDSEVWAIPRADFAELLASSPELRRSVGAFLREDRTEAYLRRRHGLDEAAARAWIEAAADAVEKGEPVPSAVEPDCATDEVAAVMRDIRRVPIFQDLPDAVIEALASRCFCKRHDAGHHFFYAGEPAERMYLIDAGEVALIDPRNPKRRPELVGEREEFGALSFVTGARHSVSAVAAREITVWVLLKRHFDAVLEQSPALAASLERFVQGEKIVAYLREKQGFHVDKAARWVQRAVRDMSAGKLLPSAADMTHEISQHGGAPVAIWLGILLDGIPESFVIGSSVLDEKAVSLSLLAGLFLSNYPEALSSSIGMRHQGMAFPRILGMWTSLMLITGVGAALGTVFFAGAPPFAFALVQGVAAGAMLTMIAQTMLPEAYFKGGAITGFATLLGFLAAISFKTIQTGGGH